MSKDVLTKLKFCLRRTIMCLEVEQLRLPKSKILPYEADNLL